MENNTFLSPEFLSFASAIIRGVSLVTGVLLIAAFIQLIHISQKRMT
jgi:hypothetical protein